MEASPENRIRQTRLRRIRRGTLEGTKLYEAVSAGNLEEAKYLLSRKRRPNSPSLLFSTEKGSSFVCACRTNQLDMVNLLLEYGAEVNENDCASLFWALVTENLDLIKILIKHKVNTKLLTSLPYLINDLKQNRKEIIKELLSAGEDLSFLIL